MKKPTSQSLGSRLRMPLLVVPGVLLVLTTTLRPVMATPPFALPRRRAPAVVRVEPAPPNYGYKDPGWKMWPGQAEKLAQAAAHRQRRRDANVRSIDDVIEELQREAAEREAETGDTTDIGDPDALGPIDDSHGLGPDEPPAIDLDNLGPGPSDDLPSRPLFEDPGATNPQVEPLDLDADANSPLGDGLTPLGDEGPSPLTPRRTAPSGPADPPPAGGDNVLPDPTPESPERASVLQQGRPLAQTSSTSRGRWRSAGRQPTSSTRPTAMPIQSEWVQTTGSAGRVAPAAHQTEVRQQVTRQTQPSSTSRPNVRRAKATPAPRPSARSKSAKSSGGWTAATQR